MLLSQLFESHVLPSNVVNIQSVKLVRAVVELLEKNKIAIEGLTVFQQNEDDISIDLFTQISYADERADDSSMRREADAKKTVNKIRKVIDKLKLSDIFHINAHTERGVEDVTFELVTFNDYFEDPYPFVDKLKREFSDNPGFVASSISK